MCRTSLPSSSSEGSARWKSKGRTRAPAWLNASTSSACAPLQPIPGFPSGPSSAAPQQDDVVGLALHVVEERRSSQSSACTTLSNPAQDAERLAGRHDRSPSKHSSAPFGGSQDLRLDPSRLEPDLEKKEEKLSRSHTPRVAAVCVPAILTDQRLHGGVATYSANGKIWFPSIPMSGAYATARVVPLSSDPNTTR